MKLAHFIFLLACFLVGAGFLHAEQPPQFVSVCAIQENPEKFLNENVEVRALIIVGTEYGHIQERKCSFGFAFGDDYQTFGDSFHVRNNGQWNLMRKLLGTTGCASNVRAIQAKISGTVARIPATGTIPENEMGFELIIQSVSEVSRVPIKCTPRKPQS